jgi:hypothetical protein
MYGICVRVIKPKLKNSLSFNYADIGLHGIVETGVYGLVIGGSTVDESEVGREVNNDGDICLVKIDGLG